MDERFWHQKWDKNEIAFHQREVNPFLAKYLGRLKLPAGGRVFLPLCGKTLDIAWLLSRGYQVAGAELSELAINQLFAELGLEPAVSEDDGLKHYRATGIDMFVGDIFRLSAERLAAVDAVYDRAALVALPAGMRQRYAAHVTRITANAPQLLISFEYDQQLMEGPPFSVVGEEIRQHYGERYALTLLERSDVAGGLKGRCVADETTWLLEKTGA